MTTFPTNLTLALSQTDPAFEGTPQQFAEHVVGRLEIRALTQTYGLSLVSSLPVANEGPVLLMGTQGSQLYVWDENTSTYVPADITDALHVPSSDKYILTSDAGTWGWKKFSDFWTWAQLGIGNLTAGAANTIAYSNGTVNAWGSVDVALPTHSVAISKLKCEATDAGRYAQAQSDGSVSWGTTATVRGQVLTTDPVAIPDTGNTADLFLTGKPTGAILIRVVIVAQADATPTNGSLFNGTPGSSTKGDYGYSVGDEIELMSLLQPGGNAGRVQGFSIVSTPTNYKICRSALGSGTNWGCALEVTRRDGNGAGSETVVYVNEDRWKIKGYYL